MEIIYVAGFNFSERFCSGVAVRTGENMSQLDFSGIAVFFNLYDGNQIQAQQGKVVQIILRQRFLTQVCVDETQSPESSCPTPESPYIGKIQVRGVSKDYVAYDSVARKQDSDLTAELLGECGYMFGQFRRYHLLRKHTSPESPFQSASL